MGLLFAAFLVLVEIWGGELNYVVKSGDSLPSIGARLGVDAKVLAETNNLKTSERLSAGSILRIDNGHIVPVVADVDIVVNVPQRMLFLFEQGRVTKAFPVAAGGGNWRTPLGGFSIDSLEVNPTWDVPVSIQEEMRRQGKPLRLHVPPSPSNPLGKYWIGLSLSGVGIHGTNAPGSIYRLSTHGCIRLHPDDIKELFGQVDAEMGGLVVYEPVLVAARGGSVFMEVHPDVYKRIPDMLRRTEEIARAQGVFDIVDWSLAREVIRKREGIGHDVTRR
jgi:L,D-transpeptidase ErfK/SrfK